MNPGEFSFNGYTLTIDHPIGGIRYAAHVFDLDDGQGIGFVDHGWSSGSASQPLHLIHGEVTRLADNWIITMPHGEVSRVWYEGSTLPPDGDRGTALHLLIREFPGESFTG